MCLCVAFAQLRLYSSIWDASVGLIIGLGAPNGVKFDISNPDKITKIAKSYSLRQEFHCIGIHGISPSHRWSISPPPVRSVIPGIGEMGNCIGEISSNII